MQTEYQFRIVGNPGGGKRRLVDANAANAAYAGCDPRCEVDRESYLSAFWYGADFSIHLSQYGSVKSFNGFCWSPWLWFDIDRDNDLQAAHADTLTLSTFIGDEYDVRPVDQEIYFSGSKGFHLGVPLSWQPDASRHFHETCKRLATEIGFQAGIKIDPAIYTRTQPFRAPNSRHQKSGLYKRRLTVDQLEELSTNQVIELANKPHRFDWRLPCRSENKRLRVGWELVVEDGGNNSPRTQSPPATSHPEVGHNLNRQTMEFIRDGAPEGDRHRLLFSAAANLAEFGCSVELAHAILTDSGLDSGLPPKEVKRQIDCGLRKGGVVCKP